jgi:CheY-specific phosphatase CheX
MNESIQQAVFEVMLAHLKDVAQELFAAYGFPVRLVEAAAPSILVAPDRHAGMAVIGFVGTGVRGALVMVALESAIRAWLAAAGESGSDPADALGEFSNMLLGRLKSRLLGEGLTLQLATPATAIGTGLKLSTPPPQSAWVALESTNWGVEIRIEAHFSGDFALENGGRHSAPALAGEGILF